LEEIIEDQMAAAVDRYLDQLQADDAADRRNGYYRRHLLTELGDIELNVPRTRRYSRTLPMWTALLNFGAWVSV
jgi:transposase-like protein